MRWVTAASALLAFLLYYNTLNGGFVYDDRRAIVSNPDVIGHTPIQALFENDFWGTPLSDPGSHGSYRPLCVATFRLNYIFSGFKPWSYHLINIILHCTATVLVVVLAYRLLPCYCIRVGAAVAGLTFAAHPIHTEAVAGIVGRADLAACNLFLLSFLLYSKHIQLREERGERERRCVTQNNTIHPEICNEQSFRLSCHGLVQHIIMNFHKLLKNGRSGPMKVLNACNVKDGTVKSKCHKSESVSEDIGEVLQWLTLSGTLVFAAAGTLCKEPAIMVLPLCIFYDFLKGIRQEEPYSKNRWRSICTLSTGGIALLYWRIRIAGTPMAFAAADNPASRDPSFFTRLYTFLYLPVFNFFLLLYPINLSFDWSMDSIPLITTIFDARNLFTLFFYGIISKTVWKVPAGLLKKDQGTYSKEVKFYKKQNSKGRHKRNYNSKQYNRGQECVERKNYRTSNKASKYSKKLLCPCPGCKHPLTDEHTTACRAINNNNAMMHYSTCVCPMTSIKCKFPNSHRHICRNPQVVMLMFAAFMILPFIPATNAFFYVGFVVAERVLYIPSVGFCLLLGLGAGTLTRNWHRDDVRNRLFMLSLLIVLSAMCGKTLRRNLDWYDEESLFKSAIHINPSKAYGNLGSILSSQGRTEEAIVALEKALELRPTMADTHFNLGILLQNQGRYGEAIKSFERAIHFRPSLALAYVNLGISLVADGRLAEAESALRAGSRVEGVNVRDRREHDSAKVSALVQLAELHSQLGHFHKALSAYKEALQILPDTIVPTLGWTRQNVLSKAGDIYVKLQQWPQAEHSIMSALAAAPYSYNAKMHLSLGQIVSKNKSRTVEAEMWYKKAMTLAPNDASIHGHYAAFLRSQGKLQEAAKYFEVAAQLAPKDSVRAADAANGFREAGINDSAEKWFARAVQLNPKVAEFHSNLGAILHVNGKYAAALKSTRRALHLKPNDEDYIINLKKLRSTINKQKLM